MAEAATIARPYAKAAFMSARDANELPRWSAALQAACVLVADARIADRLQSPRTGIDQIVAVFAGLCCTGTAADQVQEAHWQNFVRLLAANKRLEVLPDITVQYGLLRAHHENELDVEVTSAVAMSDMQQMNLAAALKRRFKREVRIKTAVDSTLLGGAVIRAGDLVIDGSINGRLQRMASNLSS